MRKVSVLLDEEKHADIIRWLEKQPNNSEAFRQAARLAMQRQELLDAETVRQIIREELAQVTISNGRAPAREIDDADPEAGARLDQMF